MPAWNEFDEFIPVDINNLLNFFPIFIQNNPFQNISKVWSSNRTKDLYGTLLRCTRGIFASGQI
jgi:hypothetical protein